MPVYKPIVRSNLSLRFRNFLNLKITVDGLVSSEKRRFSLMERDSLKVLSHNYVDENGFHGAVLPSLDPLILTVYDTFENKYPAQVFDLIELSYEDDELFQVDLTINANQGDLPDGDAVTRVRGVISENYQPVSRVVRVYDYHTNRFIGETVSDPVTGEYEVNTSPYTGEVMRLVMQDYGQSYQPTHDYEVGDIVHPSTANGYVFQCSVPGLSGDVEPEWSNDGLTVVTTGESSFSPIEFYRPIMDGPVKPVVVG